MEAEELQESWKSGCGCVCVCVGGEVLGLGEESKKASWRRQWLNLQKRVQSNWGRVRKATAQAKNTSAHKEAHRTSKASLHGNQEARGV